MNTAGGYDLLSSVFWIDDFHRGDHILVDSTSHCDSIRAGCNLGSLGDRINLPPGSWMGLVLMTSSHKAKY